MQCNCGPAPNRSWGWSKKKFKKATETDWDTPMWKKKNIDFIFLSPWQALMRISKKKGVLTAREREMVRQVASYIRRGCPKGRQVDD